MYEIRGVPSQKELGIPALIALSDGMEKSVDDVVKTIEINLNIPSNIASIESNVKGKSLLKFNIEWTLNGLRERGLVESPKKKFRIITDKGREILADGKDPWNLPIIKDNAVTDEPTEESDLPISQTTDNGDTGTFFAYLANKGLRFDSEIVEDFLLSLKAKQFLILSGGTGTGKTKLAQAYGEYISRSCSQKIMIQNVTLTKAESNMGFTLNRENFFTVCPEADVGSGNYRFKLGEYEGTGNVSMTPRFWFRNTENLDDMLHAINQLKQVSDKANLEIYIPGRSGGDAFEIVPVGSNWTDSRHVIGYMNSITGEYVGTQSLDLMLRASKDPANPYMLILDEMNLSHVERYFSDILSSMESGSPIPLQSKGTKDVTEKLPIGSNLFIVGTVNLDETTYMFSPKVLDRANVIEFKPVPVTDYLRSGPSEYTPKGDVKFLQNAMAGLECRSMSAVDIARAIRSAGINDAIVDNIASDLNSIQKIMSDMQLPFGFRTVDEIFRFMYVAWMYEGKGSFSNWKRYLDTQIHQKIIPKIHGNSSIASGLKSLRTFCSDNGYNRSAQKLSRMVDILEKQRYVSFNC